MSYEDDGAGFLAGIFVIVIVIMGVLSFVIPTPKERAEAKAKVVDTVRVVDTVVVKSPAVKVDSTPTLQTHQNL